MQINDILYGFQVENSRYSTSFDGTLWELKHLHSGANLLWMDNGNENKLFSVTFLTPPQDNTGVFHILEHSVLNGSRKYPVKEPFVELMKSSMSTFLNAVTMPDRTMYPVSSRNTQDFLNLMQVYLDGVFAPAIASNPCIFLQEGWHVDFDEDGKPFYTGVVLNEMKGAYADPQALLADGINAALFPDNCYGFSSGGKPEEIPGLTYQAFLAAHQKYYHPSNARFYLDGDLPIETVLKLLDSEYLAAAEPASDKISIPLQDKISHNLQTGTYLATEEDGAYFALGKIICTQAEREKLMGHWVLANYLAGSNEAPLKKAVLEAGLAQDVALYVDESGKQPSLILNLIQMEPEGRAQVLDILRQVRHQLLCDGLDKARLSTVIDQMEFQEKNVQEPTCLGRLTAVMNPWIHGCDPMVGLENEKVLSILRQRLDSDYFDRLFRELACDEAAFAQYLLLPSAEQAQVRADSPLILTEEEQEEIRQQNQRLSDWQNSIDRPEVLDSLPRLSTDDVDFHIKEETVLWDEEKHILTHPAKGNGIIHLELYFSMDCIATEQLEAVSFLTNLLGELPTKSHSYAELEQLIRQTIGELDFNVAAGDPIPGSGRKTTSHFCVSASLLEEKLPQALELLAEILTETIFDGVESEILTEMILMQGVESLRQGTILEGHEFARKRALSHCSVGYWISDRLEGYGFYQWLLDFADQFEEKLPAFCVTMDELRGELFSAENLIISVAGTEKYVDFDPLKARLSGVIPEKRLDVQTDGLVAKEFVFTPATVSFAVLGGQIPGFLKLNQGALQVLSAIISYEYLWNEVRVKNGAYGCGLSVSDTGLASFYSYRDPKPENSLAVFRKTGDFVRSLAEMKPNIIQYTISTLAGLDPLLSVPELAQNVNRDFFAGKTEKQKQALCAQLKTLQVEDLLALAEVFDVLSETASQCVFGE